MNEIIRTTAMTSTPTKYCPGCLHSMATKLIAECLEELGVADRTIAVLAVGCSTMGQAIWNTDVISAAHGRAPAVATGVKRTQPDTVVFTYQGDGDLASIGLSEVLCAANRGEKFTVIFANNSTYGMTGGQMAPTTLVGQKSTTTPRGRDAETDGFPIDMCALINQLRAPSYIARCALNSPANVTRAKACIKRAFEYQLDGKAFAFVELLTNCVTNLGVTPLESLKFIEEKAIPVYPLGVFRDADKGV